MDLDDQGTADAIVEYLGCWPPGADAIAQQAAGASPSEIIPGLFVGSIEDATNKELLAAKGVTAIVNCAHSEHNRAGADYPLNKGTVYLGLPVYDIPGFPINTFFDNAIEFIHDARQSDRAVLVHCNAGVSRSATVAAAYLMKHELMRLRDALTLLKARRRIICPNMGFIYQLQRWEHGLYV